MNKNMKLYIKIARLTHQRSQDGFVWSCKSSQTRQTSNTRPLQKIFKMEMVRSLSSFYRIFTRKFYSFLGHDSNYYSPSVIYFVLFFFILFKMKGNADGRTAQRRKSMQWVQNTAKSHRHRNLRISLIWGTDTATDVACTNLSQWYSTAVCSSSLYFPLQKPEQSV